MKLNYILAMTIALFSLNLQAQIGIGNTNPQAVLDISASNATAPSNQDGILIPRLDIFPTLNPTVAQDGMLIFITGNSTPSKGFYYWDVNTLSWVMITTGGNDSDWYIENSTDIPTSINDNIFTLGKVSIGKNNANSLLDIDDSSNNTAALSILKSSETLTQITGTQTTLAATNGNGTYYANKNLISNNGDGEKYGVHNTVSQNGFYGANKYGFFNDFTGNSTAHIYDSYGLYNKFRIGDENLFGVYNDILGNSNSTYNIHGSYNLLSTSNIIYGIENMISNTLQASGIKNTLDISHNAASGGLIIGVENNFNVSTVNDSNTFVYGLRNIFENYNSNDNAYGVYNFFNADTSTGNKYGIFNFIQDTSSGTNYGIYSFVPGVSNYSGYFLGNVYVGSTTSDGYLLPTIDGNSGQVIVTDGVGQLSFVDPSSLTTGNIKIDDLLDGKSDNDGTQDGSSIFLGINAGVNDDGTHNQNIGIGYNSLTNNSSGYSNISLGYNALENNTQGNQNISLGTNSLLSNTTGSSNIAIGNGTLRSNTTAGINIAIGTSVLGGGSGTGNFNIGIGNQTLYNNTDGSHNIGFGHLTLQDNTSGFSNISFGSSSLENNTSGNNNIAIGNATLAWNQTSSNNIAIGNFSLNNATQGSNIGIGNNTGRNNNSGTSNVYLGHNAGFNHSGSNTLWIENSVANENSALIYGEFDNNILRTNSEFQIGNPTTTGYAFPTSDGTANQVLRTNGSGAISWSTINIPAVSGTTNYIPKFTGTASLGDSQVFDSGTNVGIGTNTPSEKFSVNGLANLNEGIASGIALKVNGSEALWYNGSIFSWGFGGTSNLFVDKVGIGAGTGSSNYKLEVRDTQSTNYVAYVNNLSTSSSADGLRIELGYATPGVNNRFISFYGNGVMKGRISGNTTSTGTTFYTTSDGRLKENIVDIPDALSQINTLQPRKYNYITNPKVIEYGFIAQELQKTYPQAVSGSPDSNVKTDPMMVSYAVLTPILTAGIKELHQEIQLLKEENSKLKAQLNELKSLEKRLELLEAFIKPK